MSASEGKEQMNKKNEKKTERSGETHTGTPNPEDPNKTRSTEQKRGYGCEGGEPRTSSDQRYPSDNRR
jgi:hypothetical protein